MKILYTGFTVEELASYRDVLAANCLTGIQEVITLAAKLSLEVQPKNLKLARSVLEVSVFSAVLLKF